MEIKSHGQFLTIWCGVKDAIFNRRSTHFANRHKGIILTKSCFVHHTQIVMHDWLISIGWLAILLRTVRQHLIFSDNIDDIKAEALDSFVSPKIHHFKELLTNIGVAPIEVSLSDIIKMQIIFARIAKWRPGTAAKLGQPVRWLISQDKKVLIVGIPSQRLLEPLVFNRAMIENHIQHKVNTMLLADLDHLFKICHISKDRVNCSIVRNIITIVPLRTRIEWIEPDHVHSQLFQVGKLFNNPSKISQTIASCVFKRFWINLVDNLCFIKCHIFSFFEKRDRF